MMREDTTRPRRCAQPPRRFAAARLIRGAFGGVSGGKTAPPVDASACPIIMPIGIKAGRYSASMSASVVGDKICYALDEGAVFVQGLSNLNQS
jgi:hypothetical protein